MGERHAQLEIALIEFLLLLPDWWKYRTRRGVAAEAPAI